jgi:hypothetical protein
VQKRQKGRQKGRSSRTDPIAKIFFFGQEPFQDFNFSDFDFQDFKLSRF